VLVIGCGGIGAGVAAALLRAGCAVVHVEPIRAELCPCESVPLTHHGADWNVTPYEVKRDPKRRAQWKQNALERYAR
jgi:ketopantoate reductase